MARPIRIERAGGWYHITARGNERRWIYRDDKDRRHFCELLEEMVGQFDLVLPGFVLMVMWKGRCEKAWKRARERS